MTESSGAHHHHQPHPSQPDLEDQPLDHYRLLAEAIESLLVEKGVVTPEEIHRRIDALDSRSPALGARMVARAWVDRDYEASVLADVNSAARELDIDAGLVPIRAVKDTTALHNVIVCTLCSCYPRALLGPPPDWYKSRAYRSRVVREPRAVLAEFGTRLPDEVEVRVHDSTANLRYMVLPRRPPGTDNLDEGQLAGLVTRDCLIGVALPRSPSTSGGGERR